MPSSGLPALFDAVRCLLWGHACRLQERYDEALASFDQAEALNPDIPAVHQARAATYNGLGRHEEALASLDKYERIMGSDDTLYEHRANALLGLKRFREAAEASRKGLDDAPDSWANLAALATALPPGDKSELADRFAAVTSHQAVFRAVAGNVVQKQDADALAALVPAYRKTPSGKVDPYADYYEGQEMLLRGRYEEAARILAEVRPRMPEGDQPLMDTELRRALLELGRYADAYRAASSPTDGFDIIANHIRQKKDLEKLREVIALHAKAYAGRDAAIHFYEGHAFDMEGKFDKAAEAFLKGMELAPEEHRHNYRREGVASAFAAGRMMDAYERFGKLDRNGTFVQLAVECSRARRADWLEALLERHRREAPPDPGLARWDAEVYFQRGEYSAAIELLTRHRDALLKGSTAAGYWDLLIRSLVRTKQFQEAIGEAEAQAGREEGVMSLVALAYAAAGNAGRAMSALDRHLARDTDGSLAQALYRDEDLGPLLRSDLLRAWREKHPPPSTQPAIQPMG
jgi:tetratricopeptide (TPR) repeat protein